ncbi:hypothetical protein CUD01_12670 [Cellulomonas uda]|uniref:PemK-like, MazF-like toxin of type II toxin-antitoxin system n=1 Tax=Cellulomonas uda TaxID=1714 RepID=A0A4Y3KA16_CELUD|nr:hypothetical protein CUD01_12670 [Cellulomonas uda]
MDAVRDGGDDMVAWLTERAGAAPPWVLGAAALVALLVVAAVARRARRRPGGRPGGRRGGRPRGRGPRPGELWFALVPFEDRSGAKDRPVLVLDVQGGSVVVAQLTSQDKSRRRDHVPAPARLTGMRKDGWLELRTRTVPRGAFRRRAGDLGPAGLVWFERELERAGTAAGGR